MRRAILGGVETIDHGDAGTAEIWTLMAEKGVTFERSLMENKQVRDALTADELRAALDPTTYVGHAPQIVERVVKEQEWIK